MLQQSYRFYLAFENSNCNDYITEKFWYNAIQNDIVPIVMGPHRHVYERLAPPNSFIHVDDFESPADLARYLKLLSKNKTKYLQYFKWKQHSIATADIVFRPSNSNYWCDLCSALHTKKEKHIHSVDMRFYIDNTQNQMVI